MTTDIEIRRDTPSTTIGDVAERLRRTQEFVDQVLVPANLTASRAADRTDGDYGVIPGTGKKKVLLKPGAEKLARLFDLSVSSMERTIMERVTVTHDFGETEGWCVAYSTSVSGPDGAVWGRAEAFASHEEQTFHEYERDQNDWKKRTGFKSLAPLNTIAARAQKRAYVRSVVQALGISSMFSTEPALRGGEFIDERQREIVVEIYRHAAPRLVEQTTRQATKIKQSQWEGYLGAALDLAADVKGWDDAWRTRAELALNDQLATVDSVGQWFDVIDAEVVGEVAS